MQRSSHLKSKKVFYSSFRFATLKEISKIANSKYGFCAVYCTIDQQYVEDCALLFPNAVIHSIQDARCIIPPSGFKVPRKYVIDHPVIHRLMPYESIFYFMADRMDSDGHQFSSTQRRRFFYNTIKYWCDVLIYLDVHFVMSRNVPHFPSEYGLYIASKLLDRPFLMTDQMASLERSWIISSIEDRSMLIRKKMESDVKGISAQITSILKKQRSDYTSAAPKYFIKNRESNQLNKRKIVKFYVKSILKVILKLTKYKQPSGMTLKINHLPISSGRSMPNIMQKSFIQLKARHRIKRNKIFYEKLCKIPSFDTPYIYFAPNYQPERTTLPDAGIFADVLRMLDLVASVLPEKWIILYKEHPSIFNVPVSNIFWRGHMYRDKEFYESISEYKNVQIIPVEINSFDLIDNAKFVVTATGTVAFESVTRGVPALVFGSVWFDAMEGVTRVNSKRDIEKLINKINKGYKPLQKKVEKYLQIAWNISSPKYPNLLKDNISEDEKENYIRSLDNMIVDYIKCLLGDNTK